MLRISHLLLAIAAITAAMCLSISSDPAINLKFVVNVEGKSYFSDNTSQSWSEASAYCKSLGMKLASLTSDTQLQALTAAYSPDFKGNHWTSGRDVLSIRQFVWNETEEALEASFQSSYRRNASESFHTCLGFASTTPSFFFSAMCSYQVQPLCET